MSNEVLFFIEFFAVFSGVLVMYKAFGKHGLYAWMIFAAVVSNLQVQKYIHVFGITATLGNALYASSFLATDILSENFSDREARKGVFMGFAVMLIMLLVYAITLWFVPEPFDVAHDSLKNVIGFTSMRIVAASFAAYLISNTLDITFFSKIHSKYPRLPWLRNNGSTFVSQLIDTAVFVPCAFYGAVDSKSFWEILISTYIFKVVGALIDTPFFYASRSRMMKKPLFE